MLVLTRQSLPVLDQQSLAGAKGLLKGAYVLSKEQGDRPDMLLIGTGSEVHLLLDAQRELATRNSIDARVVSMPSWELFRAQAKEYCDEVLPPGVTARLAVEAGSPQGWKEWVGDTGAVVGITRFGTSAPAPENFSHYGFSVENITTQARKLLTT
jgi:transketolase